MRTYGRVGTALVTANATVFARSTAPTTTAHLIAPNGESIVAGATVTAMHQTDWQGRVALSAAPRTNYCTYGSEPWAGFYFPPGAVTGTDSGIASASGDHFCLIAFTSSASPDIGTFISAAGTWYAEFSLRAPSATETDCNWLLYDNANFWEFGSEAVILYGPGTLLDRNDISGLSTTQDTRVRVWGTTPAGSKTPNTAFYCYAQNRSGAILIADISIGFISDVGAYIPTTSAAVTVTDYAVDSSGNVTLGQSTTVGATLDWDGTGYILSGSPDPSGPSYWVEVDTATDGNNDAVWLTTLAQCLKLNLGESPFFANYGIPQYQTIVTQVFPDYYVSQTQVQFSPYFASLAIQRVQSATSPIYNVTVVTHRGSTIQQQIPT